MSHIFQYSSSRIHFVDIARIFGVILVFYGHFIESYMKAGSAVAAMHYKFIYSFHMPFFFILSGYIAKEYVFTNPFDSQLRKLVASRLLPYLFFATILILPTFWTTDFTVGLQLPSAEGYLKGIAATLLAGFPYFNVPVWFLVCLFVVELIHYQVSRFLDTDTRIIIFALGFYLIGSILAWNATFLRPTNMLAQHGKIYPYFMILEAFTGYSLYLVGVYLRRRKFLQSDIPRYKLIFWALACIVAVYLTFDLNKAMFTIPFYDAVIMLASSHGNVILFPLTAIIGSIMIMLLAKAAPRVNILLFLGSNSLIVFALNGVFYHFINDRLTSWLLAYHSDNALYIFPIGVLATCISISLTIPFVSFFNRFTPQLIGKPQHSGPWIPRLVS